MKKKAPLIAFLGTDGVGKSTIIDELEKTFTSASISGVFIHHRSKGKPKPEKEIILHHDLPPHSFLLSVGKVLFRFFKWLLEYYFDYSQKMRKEDILILQDRPYFYDMAIDPLRYRYGGPSKLVWFLAKLAPQADTYITFDAPINVLLARKQEVSKEELIRQRIDYINLADSLANSHIVSTDQSLKAVTNEVSQIIATYLV
ncbi:MAG: hypothetical protein GY755_03305 [Chloroflexi bacterium]|nr:hypothetical protein [Chloroflexota bacterium]